MWRHRISSRLLLAPMLHLMPKPCCQRRQLTAQPAGHCEHKRPQQREDDHRQEETCCHWAQQDEDHSHEAAEQPPQHLSLHQVGAHDSAGDRCADGSCSQRASGCRQSQSSGRHCNVVPATKSKAHSQHNCSRHGQHAAEDQGHLEVQNSVRRLPAPWLNGGSILGGHTPKIALHK